MFLGGKETRRYEDGICLSTAEKDRICIIFGIHSILQP